MQSHQDPDQNQIDTIIDIQRQIRSINRKNFHFSIFNENPRSEWPGLNILPEYHHSDLHYRLEKIIGNIVANQKIVNGKRIYHYTCSFNLSRIIQCKYLYGNNYLKKNMFLFYENAYLEEADGKYGDASSICFTPGSVDYLAYAHHTSRLIKKKSCRLTLELNSSLTNEATYKTTYNEFFKLCDMNVSWGYTIDFGDLYFDINQNKSGTLIIKILFYGESAEITFDKKEIIFYGNIFYINRFCAIQLFNIIAKINDNELKSKIYSHLNNLNEQTLEKWIVIFSQSLTLFAEYNFNTVLPLNKIRILEILPLGNKKELFSYDLSTLDEQEYTRKLEEFFYYGDYSHLDSCKKTISSKDCIFNDYESNPYPLHVFGLEYSDNSRPHIDASELPDNLFTTHE